MARWVKTALGAALVLFLAYPAWAQPDNVESSRVFGRLVTLNGLILTAVLAIVLLAVVLVLLTLVLVLIGVWKDCRRTEK